MLSWEYPPLVVGGLGRHVEGLARALAAAGHDVRVVTRGECDRPVAERRDGVRIVRAAHDPLDIGFTTESLLAWTQAADHALVRAALPAVRRWHPDVVHAHDWLVAQSAATLGEVTGAPVVTTVHATESGRHGGRLDAPLHRAIDSVERWLVNRSAEVITCSTAMRDEVGQLFGPGSLSVVPNAIDPERWPPVRRAARPGPPDPLCSPGASCTRRACRPSSTRCARCDRHIPGCGSRSPAPGRYEPALRALARRRGVARAIDWLGFVPEGDLPARLAAADVAVVPSWYEPFGIVALEAAAVGTPLVVADTGGLTDLAANGVAAGSFAARDASALATRGRRRARRPGRRPSARRARRAPRPPRLHVAGGRGENGRGLRAGRGRREGAVAGVHAGRQPLLRGDPAE